MGDSDRIFALRRAGFETHAVAAILGVTPAQVRQVIEDPDGAPPLNLVSALPDVQNALTNGALVVPTVPPTIDAHDYVSDGDTNGIFYALGTLEGGFTNPVAPDGPVVATASSVMSPWEPPPTTENVTDRLNNYNIFHSGPGAPNWVMWDFGDRKVKLREYTVKNRFESGLTWPSAWKLQGSQDGAAWTDLDTVSGPGWTTTDQWRHFDCDTVPADPFRYVRLVDAADTYLTLGEVELYGDLYTFAP